MICLYCAISICLISTIFDAVDRLLGLSFWVPENPYGKNVYAYEYLRDTPDIIFLGSSVASVGVDPAVIEKRFEKHGAEVQAYNLGVSGSSVDVTEMIIKHVLGQPEHPRILVLCANIQWVNSNRLDHRRRYLQYYAHPLAILHNCLNPSIIDSRFREAATYGFFRNIRIISRLPIISPWHNQEKREFREIIQMKGFVPRTDKKTVSDWPIQKHARWHRALDRRDIGTPFEPRGFCDEALRKIISLCKAKDTTLIVVNMPVHPLFMEAFPHDTYQRYLEYLNSVCEETKTPLLDLQSEPMTLGNQHFYDYIHLSPEGAEIFSRALADLLFPRLSS